MKPPIAPGRLPYAVPAFAQGELGRFCGWDPRGADFAGAGGVLLPQARRSIVAEIVRDGVSYALTMRGRSFDACDPAGALTRWSGLLLLVSRAFVCLSMIFFEKCAHPDQAGQASGSCSARSAGAAREDQSILIPTDLITALHFEISDLSSYRAPRGRAPAFIPVSANGFDRRIGKSFTGVGAHLADNFRPDVAGTNSACQAVTS
jgi:hypothetical protein